MGITIRVGVCRKEGTGDYGSIGASMDIDGIPVEEDMTADQIAALRDAWYRVAAEAVADELARQRAAAKAAPAPPPPAREPGRDGPPRRERGQWGDTAYRGGDEPRRERDGGRRPERSGGNGNGRRGGDETGPPRSGKGLVARLKGLDEQGDYGVFKRVVQWAKREGNDARMSDWTPEEVADGWAVAERFLEALRESDSLSAGHGGGRDGNGHGGY